MKVNCWEYLKCGRESGGAKVKELGVCPVYNEKRLDGVHGGKNAGRACWVVDNTLCGGVVQGKAINKYETCKSCPFYNLVRQEEYPDFILTSTLMAKLNES